MVFFETPNGGAVFYTGSIAYPGRLPHEGYATYVARLTTNVLRRFAAPGAVRDAAPSTLGRHRARQDGRVGLDATARP